MCAPVPLFVTTENKPSPAPRTTAAPGNAACPAVVPRHRVAKACSEGESPAKAEAPARAGCWKNHARLHRAPTYHTPQSPPGHPNAPRRRCPPTRHPIALQTEPFWRHRETTFTPTRAGRGWCCTPKTDDFRPRGTIGPAKRRTQECLSPRWIGIQGQGRREDLPVGSVAGSETTPRRATNKELETEVPIAPPEALGCRRRGDLPVGSAAGPETSLQ